MNFKPRVLRHFQAEVIWHQVVQPQLPSTPLLAWPLWPHWFWEPLKSQLVFSSEIQISSSIWKYTFFSTTYTQKLNLMYIQKLDQCDVKDDNAHSWWDGIPGYQVQHHKTPDPISTQFVGPTHNYFTMQLVITSLCCVAITSPAGRGKPTRRCDLFRLAFPEWLKNPGHLLTGRTFSSKVSQRSCYLMLIDLALRLGAKGLRSWKLL